MKNIILVSIILLLVFSCQKETHKNYVTISGNISNNLAENIDITSRGINKRIKVNSDGTFKDTLKVMFNGYQTFEDGKNKSFIYLKNGDNIILNYDYNNYQNTVEFRGKGYETSKYLIDRKRLDDKEGLGNIIKYFELEPKVFISKINKVEKEIAELLIPKGIDSVVKLNEISRNFKTIAYLKKNYAKKHDFFVKFNKGTDSPKFFNYEKYGGGKVSLDDFIGKYVYIDVWATWCGPCKREIPYLKKLVEKYNNKNIEFISISVDNGRGYDNDENKAKLGWKKMIKNKNMNWLQLYADKAWNSKFIKDYGINSIPRFILIDPQGKIYNAKTHSPSSKNINKLLNELLN